MYRCIEAKYKYKYIQYTPSGVIVYKRAAQSGWVNKKERRYCYMRIIMHNKEDVQMIEGMKESIYNNIIGLLKAYGIDTSHLDKEHIKDIIIDLGRLSYEYRMIDFAIDDYKCKVSNELDINTNQFCLEEDIY